MATTVYERENCFAEIKKRPPSCSPRLESCSLCAAFKIEFLGRFELDQDPMTDEIEILFSEMENGLHLVTREI